MTDIADYAGLGALPLRQHGYAAQNYDKDDRVALYGGHVRVVIDQDGVPRMSFEDEAGQETLGDIQGGALWPNSSRPMPSHAFAWPAIGASEGKALPARNDQWDAATEYREKQVHPFPGAPKPAEGDPGIVLPGSREDRQDDLWLPVGGPLHADHGTPAEYSSQVADVRDGVSSDVRRGGLHRMVQVAKLEGDEWAPMLNFRKGDDQRAGHGRFVEQALSEGTATQPENVIGRLADVVIGDDTCGKHVHGEQDADGEHWREQAGHLSTEAYHKRPGDPVADAPVDYKFPLFEQPAARPPIPREAEIRYDRQARHDFNGDEREGLWKLNYWTDDRAPATPEEGAPLVPPGETGSIPPGVTWHCVFRSAPHLPWAVGSAGGTATSWPPFPNVYACYRDIQQAYNVANGLNGGAGPGSGGGQPPGAGAPPKKFRRPPQPPPPPPPGPPQPQPPAPAPDNPAPPEYPPDDPPPPVPVERSGTGGMGAAAAGAQAVGRTVGGGTPEGVGSGPASGRAVEGETYEGEKRKIVGRFFRGEISEEEMRRLLAELAEKYFGRFRRDAQPSWAVGQPAGALPSVPDLSRTLEAAAAHELRQRLGGTAAMQDRKDAIGAGQAVETLTERAAPSFSVIPMPIAPAAGRGDGGWYPSTGSPYAPPADAQALQRFNEQPRGLHLQAFCAQDATGFPVLQDRLGSDGMLRRVASQSTLFVSLPEVDIYDPRGVAREDARYGAGTLGLHRGIDLAFGLPQVSSDGRSTGEVVSGFRLGADASGNPVLTPVDATGAADYTKTITLGEYSLPLSDGSANQVLQTDGAGVLSWTTIAAGSGDISSGSNLTSGRVVKATDVKQIDTPVDLSLAYITADSADDTAQLLAGPGKRIEIRSPSRVTIDVNGTDELVVDAGKVTVAGSIELGHASDTTLARLSAGDLSVEGNRIYRAGGTDVPIADGGTGASTADAAVQNLTNGATSRTPVLTDEVPFNDVGTGGGKTTPQALYNLINSLTAETAPVAADKVPIYDASASQTDAVTIANLFGEGKAVVISYTGSGSSGKTVTLTGINRAHYLVVCNLRNIGRTAVVYFPDGATGTILGRRWDGNPEQTWMSLDAPAAGTAQTLTINTTDVTVNENTYTHRILVIGTPT